MVLDCTGMKCSNIFIDNMPCVRNKHDKNKQIPNSWLKIKFFFISDKSSIIKPNLYNVYFKTLQIFSKSKIHASYT